MAERKNNQRNCDRPEASETQPSPAVRLRSRGKIVLPQFPAKVEQLTMELGEALSTAAQIAVALAGFAGVVTHRRLVPVYANHSHATRVGEPIQI